LAQPHRLTVATRSYDGRERQHAHRFHQIVLPVAGSLEMAVDAEQGRVGDGQGVIVADGTPHSFLARGSNRFVVLDLPPHALLPDAALRQADAFFTVDAALDSLIRYLASEAADAPLDDPTAHHAAALLLRALERRRTSSPDGAAGDPVARAQALMRARCGEALGVAELAQAVGLSPSQFHERFRARVGMTPARFLNDVRLDRAEALLRSGDLPPAEVALAVGFSDQSALTRSLKRRRGVTPGALRGR
jgi:AraC-like DNA-binding protein